jgi:segregation and condensation protein A
LRLLAHEEWRGMTNLAPASTAALGAEPGFIVELEAFSGPLDLLLHLLREEQLEISDIPIARIADQFLQRIHELGLNQAADYLEMAGRLLRLKVQMLLPRSLDEEWEDPRAELVRRLLEYQQIREVALWMARVAERRALRFGRGYVPAPPEVPPPPLRVDIIELLEAARCVVEGIPSPVLHRVVPRPLDVEGATVRLERLLDEKAEFSLREAFGPNPDLTALLSTFLAALELARRGRLRVFQTEPFAPITVARETADATH